MANNSGNGRHDKYALQDERIESLLKEMRPLRRPLRVSVDTSEAAPQVPQLPNYHLVFPAVPPSYSDVAMKNGTSWYRTRNELADTAKPTWQREPRPLSVRERLASRSTSVLHTLPSSPRSNGSVYPGADGGRSRHDGNRSRADGGRTGIDGAVTVTSRIHCNGNSQPPSATLISPKSELSVRNAPRQASFMAAMRRAPVSDASESQNISNDSSAWTTRRNSLRLALDADNEKARPKHSTLSLNVSRTTRQSSADYGGKSNEDRCVDANHNFHNESLREGRGMRRARPKSYVLATSTSLPETEHPSHFSHDERELSSLGSMTSIEHTPRSTRHAVVDSNTNVAGAASTSTTPSHHFHKFFALFSNQKQNGSKFRSKRSRSSLPSPRHAMTELRLQRSSIVRSGWMKHQQMALGRSGRKGQWQESYAVLHDRTLFLCATEPTTTNSDGDILLPPCDRVELQSSIVDIAYEYHASSKNVVRIVTQTHCEHLLDLPSRTEMLVWVTTLQAVATEASCAPIQPTCSAVSLASTASVQSSRNDISSNATTQLIMHRYKAKASQLQSPMSKRVNDGHSVQPGTSHDDPSADNDQPSTPKSARKWKKAKAGKQGSGSSSGNSNSNSTGAVTHNVLGVRLADCTMASSSDLVPLLVQICVRVVEAHGLDTVGIYRIPGNRAAVNGLKETLSHGFDSVSVENLDFADARWRDVNVVSSLLKMFLRQLPEPLLTDKLYPFFIDANRISNHHNRLHKLRNLLRKLPRHHYATLKYLVEHLHEITKHSDINKMETRNLALMFGPSIVRPSDDNMATMVTHMSDQCKIIETFINYVEWMFNEASTSEDPVPEQHTSELGPTGYETQYGVGVPGAVSAASFNDMHNMIRKANEDQAAAIMNEGKGGKIKNILRRNSKRDKSKSKLKIESTAPAAVHPRFVNTPPQSSVDSAFCGNYQERDIDAEILSRKTASSCLEHSPSLESSFGSLPDTSRTDPGSLSSEVDEQRKRRQQDMYSARRIFIAGSAVAADDTKALDALASHTQHLNLANTPALEVLSEETREKIRRMQRKQPWLEKSQRLLAPDSRSHDQTSSNNHDLADTLSCTSDYSTTSSAPLTVPLAVACIDPPASSDYASSDASPCQQSTSPQRPVLLPLQHHQETRMQQKIRMRNKSTPRDPARRHTLSDVDALKGGRLERVARWFGLRKSSPDISSPAQSPDPVLRCIPPQIAVDSPSELTPASTDEQL